MAFYPDIYDSLTKETRLCIRRRRGRFGKPYDWLPRINLVRRVAQQFSIPETEAFNRLIQIKDFIRRFPNYF